MTKFFILISLCLLLSSCAAFMQGARQGLKGEYKPYEPEEAYQSNATYNFVMSVYEDCRKKIAEKIINNEVEKARCMQAPMAEKVNSVVVAYNEFYTTHMNAAAARDANQISAEEYTRKVEVISGNFARTSYDFSQAFTR